MAVNYERLLRDLERELLHESAMYRDFEKELGSPIASRLSPGPLRSLRFGDDADLQAVALGRLRLGRPNDAPYPAPIQSQGSAVRKVQQALLDLGYPLPRNGDDSNYGQETYNAVLAYKRRFNIRTPSGYLDGIVGPKTIARLDSNFPPGPLPACFVPGGPIGTAEGEYEDGPSMPPIPWVTCDPLLDPSPGGLCNKALPDSGTLESEDGGATGTSLLLGFYCVNKRNIHLEFTASWVEMLPPVQRPPDQRNRAPNAPKYDVSFKGYREQNLTPGVSYVRDLRVRAPDIGSLDFSTVLQRNRIFRVQYSISEH
jgi:hypothetical protein